MRSTLMRWTPIDQLPAYRNWYETPEQDSATLARRQSNDGTVELIKAQCLDQDGKLIESDDFLLGDRELIVAWSKQMPGDPLSGLLRRPFPQRSE
jgi:hypothetical protein